MSFKAIFQDSTTAQRRTLLAASLGWALDAFDVMLYALVLTRVMTDLGMSKSTAGFLNPLTDVQHLYVLRLLVCFGTCDQHHHARRLSIHPRAWDGRRMEHWSDSRS